MGYTRNPNTRCLVCSKPIYRRPNEIKKNQERVFCSLICYGLNLKKEHPCKICNKPVLSKFNRKTCSKICAEKLKLQSQKRSHKRKEKITYIHGFKVRLLELRGANCEKCGYNKTQILQVHHKDGNHNNNDLNNLELICPNCHCEQHYMRKNWLDRYNLNPQKEKTII